MATSFKGWALSWLNSWGTVETDPNAMHGSASFSVTAFADLTGEAATGDMVGAAAFAITAFATPDQPQQAGGTPQGSGPAITSRNSDSEAYRPERIHARRTVVIAGKEFDVFDPDLEANIEAAARAPEPDDLPELERQSRKLSRSFTVSTPEGEVEVPLFRPMLDAMPDLRKAAARDIAEYTKKVEAARAEERRRVMLLLLDF